MNKKQVEIFVEGKADKKFLEDYLDHIKDELTVEIKGVTASGGKDNLNLRILELNDPIVMNVIIFDTDENFKTRKVEIQNKISNLNFNVPFFLIPNDKDRGNLETVLENIINKENIELFNCWDNYIDCLNSKDNSYSTPNKKAKIFAYLEALVGESRKQKTLINEENRDYLNKDHWDLDSEYLEPLKTFLLAI